MSSLPEQPLMRRRRCAKAAVVDEWLFMFTAEAVAQQQTAFRPGARHAIMAFVTAEDEEIARHRAKASIERRDWLHAVIKRGKQVDDPDLIEDEILRSAAEMALEQGDAIIVYRDELRADS